MHKLSVIIDHSGGAPAISVRAEEVEWNSGTSAWDIVLAGKSILGVKGSETDPGVSDLWWYHIPIVSSAHYSVYVDTVLVEGYEGKFINTGDSVALVAANTAHANLVTGNPHAVTKTELSLGNVENYAAVDQCGEMTKAQIIATGLDVADLPDTAEGKFITVANILAGMVDGSANANTLLDFIGTRLGANALFAKMSSEVLFVSSGTAAANTITPKKIGAIYVKTDDSYVYVSKGLTTSDWIDIT